MPSTVEQQDFAPSFRLNGDDFGGCVFGIGNQAVVQFAVVADAEAVCAVHCEGKAVFGVAGTVQAAGADIGLQVGGYGHDVSLLNLEGFRRS